MSRKYFGTDGIRGLAGVGALTRERVEAYGRAAGAYVASMGGSRRILIGRDTRTSGPWMTDALASGFLGAGVAVSDGGILTTPAVQWIAREEGFDLAIVVSASHNPAPDNGIKFFGRDGRKLPDADEIRIETLIDQDPGIVAAPRALRSKDEGASHRYVAAMRQRLTKLSLVGRTLILDCAHGAASSIGPELLNALGASVVVVNAEPTGHNINDNAGVVAVEAMAPLVRRHRGAIAIALDGDADRVLMLDEDGKLRDGDAIMGILARDLAARGELVDRLLVTTVMSNLGLHHFVKNDGIKLEITPVGDRFVSQKMDEMGAVLGGEQSGHIIFREGARWSGDGLYAALRVLEVMTRRDMALAELAREMETFPQVLKNIHAKAKVPIAAIAGLPEAIAAAEQEMGSEGRVLIRWSGTEPLLRIMVEGRRRDMVDRWMAHLMGVATESLT